MELEYGVSEILADLIHDEDEGGGYTYWEEYDTLRAGCIIIPINEAEITQDVLIAALKIDMVEKRFLTEDQSKRVKFTTKDTSLSFDVIDWDDTPLYRLILT